ncbi:MAG: fimbrillin family protein [Muribaculaceae bacterium]|nr:fimbrillin family protein [Muribaculaceae bacterium]
MKKTLLFLTVGAMALTACTSEEDTPMSLRTDTPEAISFRAGMGTRADEVTNANISDFYVTALYNDSTLFDKVNFVKGSDNYFESSHNYYWPGETDSVSNMVKFYAYYPSEDALGADITLTNSRKVMENFSPAENIADQVDFITANTQGVRAQYEKTGVPLTFDHRLAQIEVRAKSDDTDYTYTVTGVRIGRAEYLANFDFSTNTWTLDDWHDRICYDASCSPIVLGSEAVSIMGDGGNAMLLPQTLTAWDNAPHHDPDNVARGSYLSVLVRIESKAGAVVYPFASDKKLDSNGQPRKYAWTAVPISGTWEQGKKYIYTLDFTNGAGTTDPDEPVPGVPVLGDPLKFTVKVNDWIDTPSNESMKPNL